MKVIEREKVPESSYGKVTINNINLEQHELETILCLARFGFDVETIIPSYTPHGNNPDLVMMGPLWEMKGPTSANRKTITKRFRKAVKQSGGRAVFDLRGVKNEKERIRAEEEIVRRFNQSRSMRRILIIKNDEKMLDISK